MSGAKIVKVRVWAELFVASGVVVGCHVKIQKT